MSSNRANAAARQRRAGGNEQQPPPIPGRGPPQNMQGRPGQQQQMAPPNADMELANVELLMFTLADPPDTPLLTIAPPQAVALELENMELLIDNVA